MIDLDKRTIERKALAAEYEEQARNRIKAAANRRAVAQEEKAREKRVRKNKIMDNFVGITLAIAASALLWILISAALTALNPEGLTEVVVPATACVKYIGEGSIPNMLECAYQTRNLGTCVVFSPTSSDSPTLVECNENAPEGAFVR